MLYTINYTVKPIYLRQDEETEEHYAAFCKWRDGEDVTAYAICDAHGISRDVPQRNRWRERADAHHDEVAKVMSKSLAIVKDRLQLTAVEAAFRMMKDRHTEDDEATVRYKDAEGKVHIRTKRKRGITASERIIAQVLDHVLKGNDEATTTDVSGLLQAMVQDTEDSGDASADTGLA